MLVSKNINRKWLLLIPLIIVAVIYFFIFPFAKLLKQNQPSYCSGYMGQLSYRFYEDPESFQKYNNVCKNEIPTLKIHTSIKDFLFLSMYRAQALEKQFILKEHSQEIPAKFEYDDKVFKADIRLKGDYTDHIISPKSWSLRVKLKKSAHILGMNRFSLQQHSTRGNDLDILFQDMIRGEGIIAPRHHSVRVLINGIDWGIMDMEDHFTRELQESNRHKESLIFKIDETDAWEYYAKHGVWGGLYNSAFTSDIAYFSTKQIARNPVMANNLHYSKSLLQAWQSGRLSAHNIFDFETFRRFFVFPEIWGSRHTLWWHNIRLYYNPYLAKFEPVSYDNSYSPEIITRSFSVGTQIGEDFIFDPKYLPELQATFASETLRISNDQSLARLQDNKNKLFNRLGKHGLRSLLDINAIKKNRDTILQLDGQFFQPDNTPQPTIPVAEDLSSLAKVQIYDNGMIEVINKLPFPLLIKSITTESGNFETNAQESLSLVATPTPQNKRYTPLYVDLPADTKWDRVTLTVESTKTGQQQQINSGESLHYISDVHFINTSTSNKHYIESQKYIIKDATDSYRITAGTWQVDKPLIFAAGSSVTLEAGTHLQFHAESYLKAEGKLDIHGSKDKPVTLSGINGLSWKGIYVVRSGETSHWKWAEIINTAAHIAPPIELTGGVTFYESDINMQHVNFNHSIAEDMLNIVNSTFVLSYVTFIDGVSDAFDADFSKGQITNTLFKNIGGDGLDTSGSATTISQCEFNRIHDKAISIGEVSSANIQQVSITQAGTAVAAKDYSKVDITNSMIQQSTFADLMSYTKKTEYGGALLVAHNIQIDRRPVLIADANSTLLFNQRRVVNTDLNIDTLYKSGPMQK